LKKIDEGKKVKGTSRTRYKSNNFDGIFLWFLKLHHLQYDNMESLFKMVWKTVTSLITLTESSQVCGPIAQNGVASQKDSRDNGLVSVKNGIERSVTCS
jgi:hypothetical protein